MLVVNDLLGLHENPLPRFVKKYEELAERMREAVSAYAGEVRGGAFPGPEHSYSAGDDEGKH